MILIAWPGSQEPLVAHWQSIRTSNRKVIGSANDRSTRIFLFPSMPVLLSKKSASITFFILRLTFYFRGRTSLTMGFYLFLGILVYSIMWTSFSVMGAMAALVLTHLYNAQQK